MSTTALGRRSRARSGLGQVDAAEDLVAVVAAAVSVNVARSVVHVLDHGRGAGCALGITLPSPSHPSPLPLPRVCGITLQLCRNIQTKVYGAPQGAWPGVRNRFAC